MKTDFHQMNDNLNEKSIQNALPFESLENTRKLTSCFEYVPSYVSFFILGVRRPIFNFKSL